jgi:hypothetical protein
VTTTSHCALHCTPFAAAPPVQASSTVKKKEIRHGIGNHEQHVSVKEIKKLVSSFAKKSADFGTVALA